MLQKDLRIPQIHGTRLKLDHRYSSTVKSVIRCLQKKEHVIKSLSLKQPMLAHEIKNRITK